MGRPHLWVTLLCPHCETTFQTKPCDARAGRKYCTRSCKSRAQKRPWMKGNQFAVRENKTADAHRYHARMACLEGPCVRCAKPGELVHHIDRDPSNNALSNLMRLCRACHIDEHRNDLVTGQREYLAARGGHK